MLAAVLGGADQHDLARLAREMLDRAQAGPDRDSDGFEERAVWLETTFGGAGRLHADLTPACAAALTVVLDALGQKAGPEDTRTAAQRRHDPRWRRHARRLISGQMIPGRDGQPPHLSIHIDLNELRGGSVIERAWTPAMAAAGPGSAYLTGPAADAAACDAMLTPMVTGQIDWAVLDQLTTAWLTTHGHAHAGGPHEDPADGPQEEHPDGPREDPADGPQEDHPDGGAEDHPDGPPEEHADGPQEDHAGSPQEDPAAGPQEEHPDGPREGPAGRPAGKPRREPGSRPPRPHPRPQLRLRPVPRHRPPPRCPRRR